MVKRRWEEMKDENRVADGWGDNEKGTLSKMRRARKVEGREEAIKQPTSTHSDSSNLAGKQHTPILQLL